MSDKLTYNIAMSAERTVNVYAGDNCDEHSPLWKIQCDGDRGETEDGSPIILNADKFPAGTKITISIPECPKCNMDAEICQSSECSFDWKEWAGIQYS